MILRSNLPKLREFGGRSARILDAGGWYRPFNLATHVIDLNPYDSRRIDDALDPEDDERFTADTWIVQDVCNSLIKGSLTVVAQPASLCPGGKTDMKISHSAPACLVST
jgi:hypothetical protein